MSRISTRTSFSFAGSYRRESMLSKKENVTNACYAAPKSKSASSWSSWAVMMLVLLADCYLHVYKQTHTLVVCQLIRVNALAWQSVPCTFSLQPHARRQTPPCPHRIDVFVLRTAKGCSMRVSSICFTPYFTQQSFCQRFSHQRASRKNGRHAV